MKTKITTAIALTVLGFKVLAADLKPMNYAEKSAYQLTMMVKKGLADKSFLLDLNKVTISTNATGADLVLMSPSKDPKNPNTIQIKFSNTGKVLSAVQNFTAAGAPTPIFNKANGDIILDLGSESVVDHQKESQDIVTTVQSAKEINFSQLNGHIVMDILLTDKRTYEVILDLDGKEISKGMK